MHSANRRRMANVITQGHGSVKQGYPFSPARFNTLIDQSIRIPSQEWDTTFNEETAHDKPFFESAAWHLRTPCHKLSLSLVISEKLSSMRAPPSSTARRCKRSTKKTWTYLGIDFSAERWRAVGHPGIFTDKILLRSSSRSVFINLFVKYSESHQFWRLPCDELRFCVTLRKLMILWGI